ncbi:MAG: biotin--[acetyl-CoA-carboxylase] ligase [Planctomycetota bacterium]|nr:MAG: biotin--[acetyl-CoA-carboxylase] ligase [Planctomycetota bacterium]
MLGTTALSWLHEIPSHPSSNDWVREHLDRLAPGTVAWVHRQSAGRGQRGRKWFSPDGSLTFTIRGDAPMAQASLTGLVAGLAVCEAIDDLLVAAKHRLRTRIKWPNDVYLDDGKLAGILCESAYGSSRPPASGELLPCAVGIGLNLKADFTADLLGQFSASHRRPVSLHTYIPPPSDPRMLLAEIRRYLLEGLGLLRAGGWHHLLERLRSRDWLEGRSISIDDGQRQACGHAIGIDEEGGLLVSPHHGGMTSFQSGLITVHDNLSSPDHREEKADA